MHEFTTVDGVVDVPTRSFPYGFQDDLSAAIGALTADASGILLGRTTFEMFAPAWSTRTIEDDPGAPFFDDSPKYVVASRPPAVEWTNTTVLDGYDPDRIRALAAEGAPQTPLELLSADNLSNGVAHLVYGPAWNADDPHPGSGWGPSPVGDTGIEPVTSSV